MAFFPNTASTCSRGVAGRGAGSAGVRAGGGGFTGPCSRPTPSTPPRNAPQPVRQLGSVDDVVDRHVAQNPHDYAGAWITGVGKGADGGWTGGGAQTRATRRTARAG